MFCPFTADVQQTEFETPRYVKADFVTEMLGHL
jgi:hypothetical protein